MISRLMKLNDREKPIFNSQLLSYRFPFGAIKNGGDIYFKVRLPRNLGCSGVFLTLFILTEASKMEWSRVETAQNSMLWAGMDGNDHEIWDCHHTFNEVGVYFYTFLLETKDGIKALNKKPDSSAEIVEFNGKSCLLERLNSHHLDGLSKWQVTCYDKDFETPSWLKGGLIYQIFPDRFNRSATANVSLESQPYGRVLRDDWGGEPIWQPDENGRVWNNDYFCGNLKGVEEKLDYLKSLGVSCIYLNPIFEAHSSHRYNTADYTKIDPLLGARDDYLSLVNSARQIGVEVILDGVFSHTGSDSVYFNKESRYESNGAYNDRASPYFSWFSFKDWPEKYTAWWGFKTLPEVNELDNGFMEFISGEQGIVRSEIKNGAAGWRLDVADELPDEFLDLLRQGAKAENKDSIIIGEVWEDASNKGHFSSLRRYLLGKQLDSVMNYPFRDAILNLLKVNSHDSCDVDNFTKGQRFMATVMSVLENYPEPVVHILMNHIGTHDTERAITVLAGEPLQRREREWQSKEKLSPDKYAFGIKLLKLAALIQYTLPGVPSVYYGDEAGMEGYRDPFNRFCYPWGTENSELLSWYKRLGKLRKSCPVLAEGSFTPVYFDNELIIYERQDELGRLLAAVNFCGEEKTFKLDEFWRNYTVCLGEGSVKGRELTLPEHSAAILVYSL